MNFRSNLYMKPDIRRKKCNFASDLGQIFCSFN